MRILIVEDERKVARFLEHGLREELFTVDVAQDGEEGLYRAREFPYDLLILDVLLPKLDGLQVLRAYRASQGRARVLMLTARDTVDDRVAGLDAGADDYLVKPFAFAELLARVRALLRRDARDNVVHLEVHDLRLDLRTRKVHRGGQPITLSTREFGVLAYLMRHVGEVVTRTQLAEHVWEEQFDPHSNVIDVTVYHLREKLDRGFDGRLIQTIRGSGYQLAPPDPAAPRRA
ncbi:MAG: response regulator transcription factor [Verrucomicrobiales bacterium]|nr:response regulator transcription factor [Verrucomicrobiales bacterium]